MKSLLVLAPAVFLSLVSVHAQALPEGPGKSVFENTCGGCHGLDIITGQTGTRDVWQNTVDDMRGRGATEATTIRLIVDYLTKNFAPPGAAGQTPAATPADPAAPATPGGLPEGPGKSLVENICGSCHGLDLVTGQTGTRATWQDTVDSMRGRGATGSDDDFKLIVDYLAKNFPAPGAASPAPEELAAPAAPTAPAAATASGFPQGPGESILRTPAEAATAPIS